MKKTILFAALMLVGFTQAQSQDLLKKTSSAATGGGFDVKNLTSGILGKLKPGLGLTDTQTPRVSNAVSGFLSKKASILPLQQSNPSGYAAKQSGLFSGLKSKLSGVLTAAQMTKFLGMKPKTNVASNVLSNLFY